jgi:hypothetical protein
MCTIAINVFSSLVHLILSLRISCPYLIKISLLCGYQPGEDKTSNEMRGLQLRRNRAWLYYGWLECVQAIWLPWGRCSNCGRLLHHLTRAALFQSMLDGRDISPSRWFGRLLSVCFQSFFNHVNCVSFNLVRPLCFNLIARYTKCLEWWCKSVKSWNLKVLTPPHSC